MSPGRSVALSSPLRIAIIGCGGMARHHAAAMLRHQEMVSIPVVCEPSDATYRRFEVLFEDVGVAPPRNEPDLEALLRKYGDELDAAFIITPHALHHDQAVACLEAGLHVLLEKPMVMNAAEARSLIAARDRSGRHLVVAFNGSLSPQIRTAVKMLRSGELGEILTIHGVVWQGWNSRTQHTWRQIPEMSGGGFLFDTGAHLLNTVADLAGEPVVEVAAWLDNRGRPVDILGVVMARLASGALISLSACGDTIESCASDVRVFCTKGILRTGVWGELLELQRQGESELSPVETPASHGAWEQFMYVCRGELANPSPPEIGLRMAILWDMIRASAQRGGAPVTLRDAEQFVAEIAGAMS